jgi:hypothetical protein
VNLCGSDSGNHRVSVCLSLNQDLQIQPLIIQTFYAEDQVFNNVKLDGVITLVDAKHAGIHLDEVKPKGVVNEAVEQIVYADHIILNNTCIKEKLRFLGE